MLVSFRTWIDLMGKPTQAYRHSSLLRLLYKKVYQLIVSVSWPIFTKRVFFSATMSLLYVLGPWALKQYVSSLSALEL